MDWLSFGSFILVLAGVSSSAYGAIYVIDWRLLPVRTRVVYLSLIICGLAATVVGGYLLLKGVQ